MAEPMMLPQLPTLSPIRLAFVGTYPPTPCGIATFTQSLRQAVLIAAGTEAIGAVTADVIRVVQHPDDATPDEVVAEWVRDDAASVRGAVEIANEYDCVVVQHEFGIYGADDGEDVVGFVAELEVPCIVVLHTVLPAPSDRQRFIVERLVAQADIAVVQTGSARERLVACHAVDQRRVRVIPHGATANFEGPPGYEVADGESVVLTWGLLGPGKGIEHAIRALAVLERRGVQPPIYVVAGSTHPNVLAEQGESYRTSLRELADSLGVGERVVFDDAYRDWSSLRAIVRSADVVVLPYDSRDQVTSGVLAEALASGVPIVATAFPHAVEVLREGSGIVVPHGDPEVIANALETILGDPDVHRSMAAAARAQAANLLWPRVGARYLTLMLEIDGSRKLIVA